MSAVAKRYASAYLDVATESGSLDPIGKDLHDLERLFASSEAFTAFVEHPLISSEQQTACIEKIFGKAAFPLTENLFALLIKRERLDILPDVVRIGLELWQEAKGILPVNVVSASELQADQKAALVKKLGEQTGKQIKLFTRVDESLIGGFLLRIGDQVEDHSLATKLMTFKRNVINA
jgi:F-type H+-transporting ATPase subunit delta